jgi:hydroxymethylpyrimidine/phosphomethylpyrimidine kinase
MPSRKTRPVALTIAGSDSGGGAGVQADLKTFAALGAHGTCAITCLTAQNPEQVLAVQPAQPGMIAQQLDAVFAELRPAAAKTGMLFSAPIVREVARFWRSGRRPPLVVDPVMVATSGAVLLDPKARRSLENDLLPLAVLITPNLDEARLLTGLDLTEPEDLRAAARLMADRYGCAVLVKGGHLRQTADAVDVFLDPRRKVELLLSAPYVRGLSTHGTGCTYSAAIAAYLAHGYPLAEAVQGGKRFITQAIVRSYRVHRHTVLDHTWQFSRHTPTVVR